MAASRQQNIKIVLIFGMAVLSAAVTLGTLHAGATENVAKPPICVPSPQVSAELQRILDHTAGERYKKAFDFLRHADVNTSDEILAEIFSFALESLLREDRMEEYDELIKICSRFSGKIKLTLAQATQVPEYGAMRDGKFVRTMRGDGKFNAAAHDKIQNIRRLVRIMPQIKSAAPQLAADYYVALADAFRRGNPDLRRRTNINIIPSFVAADYADPMPGRGANRHFFRSVDSFAAAQNDGERIMWAFDAALAAMKTPPSHIVMAKGDWLRSMYPFFSPEADTANEQAELASLPDNTTLFSDGRPNAVRRVNLPKNSNALLLYQEYRHCSPQLAAALLHERLQRCQYPAAIEILRTLSVADKENKSHRRLLAQLSEHSGSFVHSMPYVNTMRITLDLYFRNAPEVKISRYLLDNEAIPELWQKQLLVTPQDKHLLPCNSPLQMLPQLADTPELKLLMRNPADTFVQKLSPGKGHLMQKTELTFNAPPDSWNIICAEFPDGNRSLALLNNSTLHCSVLPTLNGSKVTVTDLTMARPLSKAQIRYITTSTEYATTPEQLKKLGGRSRSSVNITNFTTGADGGVIIPYAKSKRNYTSHVLLITDSGRLNILDFYPNRPYVPQEKAAAKMFIVTDAPLYKPHDRVRMAIFGAPVSCKVKVMLRNPLGELLQTQEAAVSSFGTAGADFQLPPQALPGIWRAEAGQQSATFRVEEFTVPECTLQISSSAAELRPGDKFSVKLKGEYYFGGRAAECRVKYRVYRMERPSPAPWPRVHAVRKIAAPNIMWWPQHRVELASGSGVTDANGEYTINVTPEKPAADSAENDIVYIVEAELLDTSGRTVKASWRKVASLNAVHLTIQAANPFCRTPDELQLTVRATRPDGTPAERQGTLRIYPTEFRDGKIVRLISPEKNAAPLLPFTTSPVTGEARIKLLPNYSGVCEVVATLPDGIAASCLVRLSRNDAARPDRLYSEYPLEMHADKAAYRPGEKIRVAISSSFPDGLLYIYPRGEKYTGEVVVLKLRNNCALYEFTATSDDVPNTFLTAQLLTQGKFFTATQELSILPPDRRLQLQLSTDKQIFTPRANVTLKLKMADATGKAAAGRAAIAVYDAATEDIAPVTTPEIYPFFYGAKRYFYSYRRSTESMRCSSYSALVPWLFHRPMPLRAGGLYATNETAMLSRNKAADAKSGAGLPPDLPRHDFRSAIFFVPDAVLNADGECKVTFRLPDNLTRWKIRAWATASDGKYGENSTELAVTQPLSVRLELPTSLRVGDRAVLTGNIYNRSNSPQKLTVALQVAGNALRIIPSAVPTEVELRPRSSATLRWQVTAETPGTAELTFRAAGADGVGDSVRSPLTIASRHLRQSELHNFAINDATFLQTLKFADGSVDQVMKIGVSPSIALSLLDLLPCLAMDDLANSFSISSAYLPALTALQALRKCSFTLPRIDEYYLNSSELPVAQRREKLKPATSGKKRYNTAEIAAGGADSLTMLRALQNSDGGWGWFVNSHAPASYIDTTCHVVEQLLRLTPSSGLAVPPEMLDKAVRYLQDNWEKGNIVDRSRIFAILAQSGEYHAALGEFLLRNRMKMPPSALINCGVGMFFAERGADVSLFFTELAQFIRPQPENDSLCIAVRGMRGTEITADYLRLLLLTGRNKAEVLPLVRYLVNNLRKAPGGNSVTALSAGVAALAMYVEKSGENELDYSWHIAVNNAAVGSGEITAANILTSGRLLDVPAATLRPTNQLEISKSYSATPLYCSVFMQYTAADGRIAPTGRDLQISRSFIFADGARSAVCGDPVDVELNIRSTNDVDYIHVRNELPGGCVNDSVRSAWLSHGAIYAVYGAAHTDFYIRNLKRGDTQLRYRLRAKLPGQFTAMPATIRGMYAPELFANSAPDTVTVK